MKSGMSEIERGVKKKVPIVWEWIFHGTLNVHAKNVTKVCKDLVESR